MRYSVGYCFLLDLIVCRDTMAKLPFFNLRLFEIGEPTLLVMWYIPFADKMPYSAFR